MKDADNLEPEYRTREEIASSVESVEQKVQNITIYPNPASEQFSINTNEEIQSVSVYDLTGRLVLTQNNPNNTINIEDMVQGLYKVVVVTASGSFVSSLIVK